MENIYPPIVSKLMTLQGREPTHSNDVPMMRRLVLEHTVRTAVHTAQPCPFENCGTCLKPDIRCGLRQRPREIPLPSDTGDLRCNYRPARDVAALNLLLADPDEAFLSLYQGILKKMGFARMDSVRSGESAARMIEESKFVNEPYHLIVCADRMEGLNGFELINFLIERNFTCPVILLREGLNAPPRSYLGEEEIVPGRRTVYAALSKPVKFELFRDTVKEVLEAFL